MAEETKNSSSRDNNNVSMAVIAYFIFFLPLLTDTRNNAFVKYHVKQGIILLISFLIVGVLGMILTGIGLYFISPILWLAVFILWIMGILNAAAKRQKPVPLIGQFAEYLKF